MIAACHFPGQIPEAIGVEQRLLELATLEVAHVAQRRGADDLVDAAAEFRPRHWWEPRANGVVPRAARCG
jgi:hypothetical protein